MQDFHTYDETLSADCDQYGGVKLFFPKGNESKCYIPFDTLRCATKLTDFVEFLKSSCNRKSGGFSYYSRNTFVIDYEPDDPPQDWTGWHKQFRLAYDAEDDKVACYMTEESTTADPEKVGVHHDHWVEHGTFLIGTAKTSALIELCEDLLVQQKMAAGRFAIAPAGL